jgi:predicted RecB family endonuclease
MILSPKYGFMRPDFVILGNYDVTFESPDAISVRELKRQVERQGLGNYANVTVLGGRVYVETVRDAFSNTKAKIEAPFVGHRIGVQMGLIKKFLREELGRGGKA